MGICHTVWGNSCDGKFTVLPTLTLYTHAVPLEACLEQPLKQSPLQLSNLSRWTRSGIQHLLDVWLLNPRRSTTVPRECPKVSSIKTRKALPFFTGCSARLCCITSNLKWIIWTTHADFKLWAGLLEVTVLKALFTLSFNSLSMNSYPNTSQIFSTPALSQSPRSPAGHPPHQTADLWGQGWPGLTLIDNITNQPPLLVTLALCQQ